MTAMSMTHKILARAAGKESVKTGEFIEANIDMAFVHDPALESLRHHFYKEFGDDAKVWDPSKIAMFQDHLVPAKDSLSRQLGKAMDAFAIEQNIKNYYPYGPNYGICHIVLTEQGHVVPGTLILGTDSHTVTHGAFNAFGSGVGLEDMMNVFRTGILWFRVPEVMNVHIDGELPPTVQAKDIILKIIGDITMAGASGITMEFTGTTFENMSAEERMTVCNMTVEAGAKNGIMSMFPKAEAYIRRFVKTDYTTYDTDPDFVYDKKLVYKAEEIESIVAYPHSPDNTRTISETKAEAIKVNQVYVGSCTGAKIEDIEAVVKGLNGDKAAPGVQFMIVPASMAVYREMMSRGYTEALISSGAVVESPGCKACYGAHGGILGDGDVCLSTTNRNFRGRMGNPKSFVYLASPYVAARTAVAGIITDDA